MHQLPEEDPPPAGETLEAATPVVAETADAVVQERIYRYQDVVDGFYRGLIARAAMDYWEKRQPTGIYMERDQALRFAETVRRHMEVNAETYGAIPITTAVFHEAFERVVTSWITSKPESQKA